MKQTGALTGHNEYIQTDFIHKLSSLSVFNATNYFAMKRKILNENQRPMEIFEHSEKCVR